MSLFQDEILAESDKIVLRLEDLCQWIIDDIDWPIGSHAPCDEDIKVDDKEEAGHAELIKVFAANNYGLQLKDVKKEKKLIGESSPTAITKFRFGRL